MADLIYLNRMAKITWSGDPFGGLKKFTIEVATSLRSGKNGDPKIKQANQWMYSDQKSLVICYGMIGIEKGTSGNIWAGAGPHVVEGQDGLDYEVSFVSWKNRIKADQEMITIKAPWKVIGKA